MTEAVVDRLAALEWDLADRMRKSLRVSGVGVQEMAAELGVERNTVGNYINGRTRPSRPTLIVWAMKTGVPLEWFENDETPRRAVPGGGSHFVLPESGVLRACRDSNPKPSDLYPATVRARQRWGMDVVAIVEASAVLAQVIPFPEQERSA